MAEITEQLDKMRRAYDAGAWDEIVDQAEVCRNCSIPADQMIEVLTILATAYYNIGDDYQRTGTDIKKIRYYIDSAEKCLADASKLISECDFSNWIRINNLFVLTFWQSGQKDRAENTLGSILEVLKNNDHINKAPTLLVMAKLLRSGHKLPRYMNTLYTAYQEAKKRDDDLSAAEALYYCAEATCRLWGNYQKARELYQHALDHYTSYGEKTGRIISYRIRAIEKRLQEI